jgi:hypothetical protein
MMSLNCPCSKKVAGWVKLFAIRHPGALLALPSISEQPYLLGLPLSQGERPFPKHSTWSSDAVEDYERQREAEDPLAFADNGWDPDTLHYNAAMKAHDSEDFKVAMIKEANDDTSRLHWAFWEKQNVPAGHKILSAIWAFKQKRRIDTPAVYKHKARINIHGGQQTYGVN